jgi:hypothetical protein
LGFRTKDSGLGSGVQGLGFRVGGLQFGVHGYMFRVRGIGFRFWVYVKGSRGSPAREERLSRACTLNPKP